MRPQKAGSPSTPLCFMSYQFQVGMLRGVLNKPRNLVEGLSALLFISFRSNSRNPKSEFGEGWSKHQPQQSEDPGRCSGNYLRPPHLCHRRHSRGTACTCHLASPPFPPPQLGPQGPNEAHRGSGPNPSTVRLKFWEGLGTSLCLLECSSFVWAGGGRLKN